MLRIAIWRLKERYFKSSTKGRCKLLPPSRGGRRGGGGMVGYSTSLQPQIILLMFGLLLRVKFSILRQILSSLGFAICHGSDSLGGVSNQAVSAAFSAIILLKILAKYLYRLQFPFNNFMRLTFCVRSFCVKTSKSLSEPMSSSRRVKHIFP